MTNQGKQTDIKTDHRDSTDDHLLWLSVGLLVGIPAQAVVGGIVVLSHLNPWLVAGHFLVSAVMVSVATLLVLRVGAERRAERAGVPLVDGLTTGASRAEAAALMAQVGLAGREAAYPRQLSLGQQRRLSLARAFAARPGILLMDEPFASLDEATRDRMLDLTASLLDSSGAGLILVTHDPAEAARLGARPLTLSGSPATLA